MTATGYGFICHTCEVRQAFDTMPERDAYAISHGQCQIELFRVESSAPTPRRTVQVWNYVLDTDDFVSTGQIRLNPDGTVDQRVFLSIRNQYADWQPSVRWTGSENTVESVEANQGPFYELTRSDTAT